MNGRRQVKYLIQTFLWSFLRHENNGKKPICLFSSRRGGSTWIQEVLCTDHRIRFVDQPFSFYSGPPFLHEYIPIFSNSVPLSINQDDKAIINAYLSKLFDGRLVHSSQWRFWKRNYWQKTNRILLKITKGKPLIEWISKTFDVHTLYLIRHPIAQSLSVLKAGWENDSYVYINNENFRAEYLDDRLEKICRRIMESGSGIEKFVLNWCLENTIPFRSFLNHPEWTMFSFEECVLAPRKIIEHISKIADMENTDTMLKQIEKPSRTAKFTNKNLKNFDPKEKVFFWKSKINNDEIKKCFAIIEQFGIDLYDRDSAIPNERYLNFDITGY